ncbi:hypothetical protein GU926_04910 [Nibribacter ruber]|uniref:Periplasmic heavy metal sensor n=1 Tax=Nibribacter ruber TaxID=2698458 RepID=A0A6P1P130_9BACT|nr:hypothetical protein [Nibribacter ruber]QHL86812.1 hypothetical protein GU926_04910 [Nibribacter ruber]
MNSLFKALVLGLCLLLSGMVHAQGLRNNVKLQERLTQAKLGEIQRNLAIPQEKMNALAPIYRRYDAEVNAIHFARQDLLQAGRLANLSNEEADKVVAALLENAVKLSTVRKNYYAEFKTVLTPQQVMAMYRSEAQMRRRVQQELRRRMLNKTK